MPQKPPANPFEKITELAANVHVLEMGPVKVESIRGKFSIIPSPTHNFPLHLVSATL